MDRRAFLVGAATVTALAVPVTVAAVYTPRPAHLSIEEYIKNDIHRLHPHQVKAILDFETTYHEGKWVHNIVAVHHAGKTRVIELDKYGEYNWK